MYTVLLLKVGPRAGQSLIKQNQFNTHIGNIYNIYIYTQNSNNVWKYCNCVMDNIYGNVLTTYYNNWIILKTFSKIIMLKQCIIYCVWLTQLYTYYQ